MVKNFRNKIYLPISDLDNFVPIPNSLLEFCFSEKDLNLKSGKKIISFLENLEKKRINYCLDIKSLPKCIFDHKQRKAIKSFKVQKEVKTVGKCSECIFSLRKKCTGTIENKVKPRKETIFDILSVHDMLWLSRIGQSQKNKLNAILDKMFEIESLKANKIYWEDGNVIGKCNYDFLFHFIEDKIILDMKEELIKNQKLISIVKNTYEERKLDYIKKEKLMPKDNRWTKLIIMMSWLDLLSEEEKRFWIEKYAAYKFTETEPKLPQAWNRVWIFTLGLAIKNINDLKKIKTVDFDKAKDIICSYIPKIRDLSEQNFFYEPRNVMLFKYVAIRKFCNKPLFEETEKFLK